MDVSKRMISFFPLRSLRIFKISRYLDALKLFFFYRFGLPLIIMIISLLFFNYILSRVRGPLWFLDERRRSRVKISQDSIGYNKNLATSWRFFWNIDKLILRRWSFTAPLPCPIPWSGVNELFPRIDHSYFVSLRIEDQWKNTGTGESWKTYACIITMQKIIFIKASQVSSTCT